MSTFDASTAFGSSEDFCDRVFESMGATGFVLADRRFETCTFAHCALPEVSVRGSRFVDCLFTSCDLSNAQLTGASLREVTFKECKLVGVNWAAVSQVSQLKFEGCVLNYAVFESLDLRKAIFHDCVAREADFADANLSEASFRGSDLSGARFANTNLTKADFRKALNYRIRPAENKIRKAKFSLPDATLLLYGLDIEVEE